MHRVFGHRFRRTSLLIAGCVGCLIGLGLARRGFSATAAAAGITLVLCIVLARQQTLFGLILVAAFGLCGGLWRGSVVQHQLAAYNVLYDHVVTLKARVLTDGTYGKSKQLSFDADNLRLPSGQKLVGKVAVSGFGLNAVYFGDELKITGKLRTTLGAAQGRLSFAQIVLVRHHPSLIGDIRRRFATGLQNALPEPLNGFALGLLVGQRATLPPDVKDALLMVGLTHIIAVSGYNLTIILRASKNLLASRSKRLSTILSLGLIIVFLLITGFSASIVRAAVVSALSIYASYYGRLFQPLLLLLLVAATTTLINPRYLWSDPGWYLSFLAFGGVMILSPLIAERLPPWIQNSTMLMITVESLAAEMATLPYLLHTFGQMSVVGLLANTLIAVAIPLAMLLSAMAGLVGVFGAAVAGWVAWPANLLLTYMLGTAELLSRWPGVFHKNIALSGLMTIELYAVVGFIWACLYFKKPAKDRIITDKNSNLVALTERMHII